MGEAWGAGHSVGWGCKSSSASRCSWLLPSVLQACFPICWRAIVRLLIRIPEEYLRKGFVSPKLQNRMCMSWSGSSLNYIHLSSTLLSVPVYFLEDQVWQVVPTFNKSEHPDTQCFHPPDWVAGAGQESCMGKCGLPGDLFWVGTEPPGAPLPFPHKNIQTTGLCMSPPQTFAERPH